MSSLGRSTPLDSAYSHARGTATFLDDTPPIAAELQLALVTSPLARGQILELDPAEALSLSGVVAVYSYRDIPGPNSLGPLLDDEPFLPEAEVSYHGQPLAVVAAENGS